MTIHDLLQQYDPKHQVDMEIVDFSKAFNTVPHAHLIKKLTLYGIVGKTHHWIGEFLIKRK